ncbi:MAG: hypothetical protein CSA42_03240 [Gammaproteobacteria bacterium]|nr:MAG: hypothetical protein CSA42_03240 [Gammaproteobacteria bacterium]
MARAKTKKQLIEASNANFAKLWQEIEGLTEVEFNTAFDFSGNARLTEAHWHRDKNIRDVLVHLYEWHQLLIHWIHANQNNTTDTPIDFLPQPYNWKTYGQMNQGFWQKHQTTNYDESVKMLTASHNEVMSLIKTFSDEALFTKKYFKWTGSTSLGSYCISSTSSHYDWAIKKLRKHKKTLKEEKK